MRGNAMLAVPAYASQVPASKGGKAWIRWTLRFLNIREEIQKEQSQGAAKATRVSSRSSLIQLVYSRETGFVDFDFFPGNGWQEWGAWHNDLTAHGSKESTLSLGQQKMLSPFEHPFLRWIFCIFTHIQSMVLYVYVSGFPL